MAETVPNGKESQLRRFSACGWDVATAQRSYQNLSTAYSRLHAIQQKLQETRHQLKAASNQSECQQLGTRLAALQQEWDECYAQFRATWSEFSGLFIASRDEVA